MYDTTNKTWHTMADMPEAHFSFAAAAVEADKKIYTFGGLTGDGGLETSYSDAMYEYDAVTDTWTTVAKTASWPHGRRCHAMVAIGQTLYLIAGFYKEGNPLVGYDLDDIWTFDTTDPGAGWTEQATVLPMKVAGHSAAVVNGKIYVPGGWALPGVIKYDVMEYDPVAGTTCQCMKNTRSASIGWPRYWIFMGAYGDEFVSIGGFGGSPGNIATTDHSGFTHFHQPYAYDVTKPD
jgi:N-acetylneuraminic acid mutarotase